MPSYFNYTARHWQHRASEMRLLARTVKGKDAQNTMLRIAQHYERLAASSGEPLPAPPPEIPLPTPPSEIVPAPLEASTEVERWLNPVSVAEAASQQQ